jgi:hypothetical protein
MIFLRKGFVVRRLQIHEGYAHASLLALRKNLHRNHFPPDRIVTAKAWTPNTVADGSPGSLQRFNDLAFQRAQPLC